MAARRAGLALLCLSLATPVMARDSLGIFGQWGAFADRQVPRCYAIAMADAAGANERRQRQPFASVGSWPRAQRRGQFHLRLSRNAQAGTPVRLSLGGRRFELVGNGADAWAADQRMDAAIIAAMRSAASLTVSGIGPDGRRFTDRYRLAGAANAMDAATLACARLR